MIYGQVPYNAQSVKELLTQIDTIGPVFGSKKTSVKVEQLIRGLLQSDPLKRLSHAELFDIVLQDPNYPNSLLDQPDISPAILVRDKKPSGSREEEIVNDFVREILNERAKYKFLIELATKTAQLKK